MRSPRTAGRPRVPAAGPFVARLLVAAAAFALAACATARRPASVPPPAPTPEAAAPEVVEGVEADQAEGVVHVVREGQTAWRIARAYGVTVEALALANGLDDPTRIATGDVLFVPGATELLEVPAYPAPLPPPGETRAEAPRADPGGPTALAWPVEGTRVLSAYGAPRGGRRHKGIDLAGERGQAVYAAEAGRVLYAASTLRGYGRTVILDHGDGLTTLYAHNSELLVGVGDRVERGQAIARIGRSGNASGHHCHFEVRRDDVPVDPVRFLSWDVAARTP